jgi:hypothetical protein
VPTFSPTKKKKIAMEEYKCEICGKKHNVFRVLESPLPDLITEIPEEERESRVNELNGFYVVDRKWFLGNGYIHIEMEGLDEPIFYWQVWATISPDDFQNNLENLMNGKTVELRGRLQSEIPFYPKSKGLEAKVIIQATDDEMLLEIRVDEDSKLKEDQSKPIKRGRVIELMQHIYHCELFKEKKEFDRTFDERLREELNYAENEYIKNEKDFAINISSPNSVLFQIISSRMLEISTNGKSGFGLHLSFDDSFEESKEEIEKFRKQDYSKDFEYHDLDDIPTYQIDLGKDKNRIEELVKRLIEDVYEQRIETIDTDNYEI